MISFIIFNGEGVTDIIQKVGGLFGITSTSSVSAESIYYFKSYFIVLIVGIIGATPIMKNIACNEKMHNNVKKDLI
jgi:alginate O-acetyltransferase complex protein AlgI